jgi:hypothetical protein
MGNGCQHATFRRTRDNYGRECSLTSFSCFSDLSASALVSSVIDSSTLPASPAEGTMSYHVAIDC